MQVSTNLLLIIAVSTTLAFALLSDPSPPPALTFTEASAQAGRATVVCQVLAVQERPNGSTLTLIDSSQGQARAFLPRALGPPPQVGQIVRLALITSDRADFFFVEGLAYA